MRMLLLMTAFIVQYPKILFFQVIPIFKKRIVTVINNLIMSRKSQNEIFEKEI